MKAFTVYQPYAHAIVAGVKHYETRPRRTHIRGRVAVHAGRLDEVQATKHLTNGEFWAVLEAAGGGGNLPRGAVIGTVEIVDCVPVEELVDSLDNRERLLGDYSPGRFAWVLQNPVMFKTPIPPAGNKGGGIGRNRHEVPRMRICIGPHTRAMERQQRPRRAFRAGSVFLQSPAMPAAGSATVLREDGPALLPVEKER